MNSAVPEDSRKLIAIETQIPSINASISLLSVKQDSQNQLLGGLEKVIMDVRHDVKMVGASLDRIQKDQEILERESTALVDKTRAEVKNFGDTMVSSIEAMNGAFRHAVEKVIESYDTRIKEDLEPRLKKVEAFNLKINGGLILVGAVAGALSTYLFKNLP